MAPSQKKALIIVGALVALAIVSFFVFYAKKQIDDAKAANEQLMLQNEQLQLKQEYENLSAEFKNYESQTQFLNNDSLLIKYGEAKDKVEKLLTELRTQRITSNKRIKELQGEIETLRGIMRHYVQVIDSLGRENAGLRAENEKIRTQNRQLTSQVTQATKENEDLSKRMTLAEKLNVSGVELTALKSNTFPFEGGNVPYTERKTFEYEGQEIPDMAIYWNVNTTLNAGTYTVELFLDDYRLASRNFTFKK